MMKPRQVDYMKSIKPGRGPSIISALGSVFSVIFGIFWTILASSMTRGTGLIIFPLFGILFIIIGIFNAIYHFKNASGKNRYSAYDITDENEEPDPLNQRLGGTPPSPFAPSGETHFCPYCGAPVQNDYAFCRKCGRELPKE